MTRPALMSLAVLIVSACAASAADVAPSRCEPSVAKQAAQTPGGALQSARYGLPALVADWKGDRIKVGPCDESVWRIALSPEIKPKFEAADGIGQAKILAGIAAVLDKYDVLTAKAEIAALAVYDAGKAAGIAGDKNESNASLAGQTFKIYSPGAPGKDAALPADPDQAAAALQARQEALKAVVIAGQAPQTVVKDGKKTVTPEVPSKPGQLVYDFYAQMERAKDLLPELAALGAAVPTGLHPILVPASPTGLNFKIAEASEALAKADSWADPDPAKGAFMAFADRAQRNRWAMHRKYVDNVYQEAVKAAGGIAGKGAGIAKDKKDKLDEINRKLQAQVAGAIGVEDARKAFDGDVAQNKDYANTAEGKYRSAQIAAAEQAAKSTQLTADGKGGYKVQYMKDGKLIDSGITVGSIAEANTKADQITSSIRDKILADHPLLAKTDAAIKAFAGGDVAPPQLGAAEGPGTTAAGCDKKGESLGEYKKRMRDQDMEAGATQSAARQKAEDKKLAALKAAAAKKAKLLAGGMTEEEAEGVAAPLREAAQKTFEAEIAQLGGATDDAIAQRVARRQMMDSAAAGQYISMVKEMAPQLQTKMPADIKAGKLSKHVNADQAETLFTSFTPKGGKEPTTLFDMFIASEWTEAGGHLRANADKCKDSVRAGDYGSLEDCAGKSLKEWLAARKIAASPAVAKKDK